MGRLLLALALAACLGLANARGAARQLLQATPGPAEQPAAAAAAPPAPAAEAASAGACCARLATIGFSSNLPVVILDTGGRPLDTKDVDVPLRGLCTCSPPGARRRRLARRGRRAADSWRGPCRIRALAGEACVVLAWERFRRRSFRTLLSCNTLSNRPGNPRL